jgi:hypothetical protein
VRNPQRLAEVLLGEVNGWTKTDVAAHLTDPDTQQIDLRYPVPVHNTYFTLMTNAGGPVRSFDDVYGHDKRILDTLGGKPVKLIAAADPALALQRENRELAKRVYLPSPMVPGLMQLKPGQFFFAPPPPMPPPQVQPRRPQKPIRFGKI